MMKVAILFCLLGAVAAQDLYCVHTWFPFACGPVGEDCFGSEFAPADGYESMEACVAAHTSPDSGDGSETPTWVAPTPDPDTYCVTSWWPFDCGMTGNASSCAGGTAFFDDTDSCFDFYGHGETEEGYVAPTPDADSYCVTNWWPFDCGMTGNASSCAGGTRYFDDSDSCFDFYGHGESAEEPWTPETPDEDSFCVDSWWPLSCSMTGNASHCAGGSRYFDDEDSCYSFYRGEEPDHSDMNGYYCITRWWPTMCGVVGEEGVDCVLGTLYYNSSEACQGPSVDEDSYCVSVWWPRECVMTGNTSGCTAGSQYYDDESSCMMQNTDNGVDDDVDPTMWCVDDWWPRSCSQVMDGDCVLGTQYYNTSMQCLNQNGAYESAANPDYYCVTNWWPFTCDTIGNATHCAGGGYNGEGWATLADCMTLGGTTEAAEEQTGDWCRTSWWPMDCGEISEGAVCRGGDTNRYETEDACWGPDGQPEEVVEDGYCVTAYWPARCAQLPATNCVGWYPEGGFDTLNACMAAAGAGNGKKKN